MSTLFRPVHCLALLVAGPVSAQFGAQYQFFCDGVRSVEVADVNGDQWPDLIHASRQGLAYLLNDGTGGFGAATIIGIEESVAGVGDVDQNGLPDILASRDMDGGISLYINNGDGQWAAPVLIAPAISANELHVADLDADGDKDAYFVSEQGHLFITYNTTGFGTFSMPVSIASVPQMAQAQALDVDGDQDVDLVYSSPVMDQVRVCFNVDGAFMPAEQLTISGHGCLNDMDNDGHADLLVASSLSGQVGWQRNLVDQVVFAPPQFMDMAFSSPELVRASDLDGDGDLDAIITSGATEEVAWYANTDGQGTFGPRQTVVFDVPVTDLATGDVDGDGDAELFVASAALNKVIQFTNISTATGGIYGRVFNDINGDGVFNGNDHGLANMRVESSDLGATYTNASGMYWFQAVPTAYTVSKPAEEGWSFTTPSSYNVVVPAQGASQYNDFGLQADGPGLELSPELGSAPMRCAENVSYWASVANSGNHVADVALSLDLDDLSTFVSADPQPTSMVNGVATWVFPNVQPTHQRNIHLVVHLPGSDHVGQPLHDVLTATATMADAPMQEITINYDPILLCAVDPNDKLVRPAGVGPNNLTPVGSEFVYMVRFQNTGNAMAHNVTILDTLDTDLDHASLRILGGSHTFQPLLQPDGVLRFFFPNIMLPDSGSDMAGSQGYVRFAIKHLGAPAEGTVLNNTADIYFDNNAPVITNTTVNTLTYGGVTAVAESAGPVTGGIRVFPNPALGSATVHLGSELDGRVDIQLFNASGALVRQLSRRSSTVLLERGDLPVGTYVLRAVDERGAERVTRMAFE
jgi:uncharacterized repeat protein (TIGR01451 family)